MSCESPRGRDAVKMSDGIYGEFTRRLRRTWTEQLGLQGRPAERGRASSEELRRLFHHVGVFPSKSQVFEMVQCAREFGGDGGGGGDVSAGRKKFYRFSSTSSASGVASADSVDGPSRCDRSSSSSNNSDSRRTEPAVTQGAEDGLTFGEFAFFAAELKRYYRQRESQQHQQQQQQQQHQVADGTAQTAKKCPQSSSSTSPLRTQKSTSSAYDVFLGGSCGPTTWRADIAIPFLKQHGITYYNPQQSNWVPEMIELEHQAKTTSQVMFFVLDEKTRNVVSMVEVAYLAGAGQKLIVCLSSYPASAGHSINGEEVSLAECAVLNGAMTTVHDLVEREGIPVFSSPSTALSCAHKVLREGVAVKDLALKDGAVPVRLAHLVLGDKLVRAREAFSTLDTARSDKITLADVRMAFRIHTHDDLSRRDLQEILSAHGIDVAKEGGQGGGGGGGRHDAGSSSTASDLPVDQALIDFNHFCCILAEFKNRTSRSSEAVAGGSAPAPTGGDRRRRRGKAATASFLRRKVLAPFSRISHWMRCGRAGREQVQLRQRGRRQQGSPSPAALPPSVLLTRRGSQVRDVYLGGTLRGGDHWRDRQAIPALKKHGLTYHDSRVAQSSRSGRLIPLEAAAMDNSRCLLFVILGGSCSVSSMCEAAYYVGHRGRQQASRTVVLCVQKMSAGGPRPDGPSWRMSKAALKDYNRGRAYLSDVANREGVPVFEEVAEAIECILQKCKSLNK